jgi:precorrin-4/cobalt-precorrin-4 C11-methyltransferase
MPEGETLANFARTGATLAVHLSIGNLQKVVDDLTPHYGADCPVAVVYRASWPDEQIIRATLETLAETVPGTISRTALILVGRAIAAEGFDESCLYAANYDRRYRPQSADSPWASWSHGDD